ncbi:hypothetical protein [Streptomyces sp. NBC_01197]|uniref:hypothetical protein n=1 Tax=Streptomyces sp. NBC_01197 TaxID=2903768 RepID=UPI002E160AFF|nr:hypothetical protein OG452_05250 [Streptomyces sp. NBC_01197]
MTTNFLGIPVSGEIHGGSTRVEQKPVEDLAPLLQSLIDDPTIVEFGWTQYTPYFNDGDTCEFSVNGMWVRTASEVDGVDEYGEEFEPTYNLDIFYHPSLGKVVSDWDAEAREYVNSRYEGPDEDRYNRVQELDGAIQSGAYENALLDAFGDHALVTVRNTGIEVEYYSHD